MFYYLAQAEAKSKAASLSLLCTAKEKGIKWKELPRYWRQLILESTYPNLPPSTLSSFVDMDLFGLDGD